MRGYEPLSIDSYQNFKLIKAIALNFTNSKLITEIVICGLNMSLATAKKLNKGLLEAKSLKKLRINFSLFKRELIYALMPALT